MSAKCPHMRGMCRITEFSYRRHCLPSTLEHIDVALTHWSACGADVFSRFFVLRLCADGRALGCAQILAGGRQFGAAVAAHPELYGQGRGPDLDLCFPS